MLRFVAARLEPGASCAQVVLARHCSGFALT